MAMKVIAVIGDIVRSKTITRRAVFQRRLAQLLAERTAEAAGLASPYTITLGDEFQAVYRTADTLWRDVVQVMADLHPVRARFAIGVGALSTRLNPEQALGMDGPAFHLARAALTQLKESGRVLQLGVEPAADWALANHTLALLSHQIEGWSQTRLQILAGLLRGQSVRDMEPALGISKVAVYKNIHAAALDEVAAICHELARAIQAGLRAA